MDLALALREKGYEVSASGRGLTEEVMEKLHNAECICYGDGWFPEKIDKDIHAVVLGAEVRLDNPELTRVKELGMDNTHFVNCNGLDTDGHLTTAKDIALMSKELIERYPKIHEYAMIWMDTITHTTKKGTSEFGLTNTNKLVRQYQYATGLKTGSTNGAKFCVSATAEKDGVELIAVIMAAENSKQRFRDASALLNYGFGKCQVYEDQEKPKLEKIAVEGGVKEEISCAYDGTFRYLDTSGANLSEITKTLKMKDKIKAPVKKGDKVGELVYELNGKEIGTLNIVAGEGTEKAGFLDYMKKVLEKAGA